MKKPKQNLILLDEKIVDGYEDLYQLWKDVPIIQNIADQSLFRATNQPVQSIILKVLREGMIDKDDKKRHYLTASELLEVVNDENSKLEKPIKTSMLYYHLDKLLELGLIEFVYYIEGRHKRKFFGRTAKFYLFSDSDKMKEKIEKFFSPIGKLIKHYNPDVDIKDYRKTVEKIRVQEETYSAELVDWLKENHELLYDLDIDALDLFTAMSIFMSSQNLVKQLFSPLTKTMKFLEK